MTNEHIYSDEKVSISPSVAILEGTHYPIAAISDLFVLDRCPDKAPRSQTLSPIFSVLYCTAIFAATGLLALYSCQMSTGAIEGGAVPSLIMGGLSGIILFILVIWLADRISGQKQDHFEQASSDFTLVIGTQNGHRSAISSPDRWYIERIQGCIEYAISLSAKTEKRSRLLVPID